MSNRIDIRSTSKTKRAAESPSERRAREAAEVARASMDDDHSARRGEPDEDPRSVSLPLQSKSAPEAIQPSFADFSVPALPDASAPPAEIVTAAEAIILKATEQRDSLSKRLTAAWTSAIAPAVTLVHGTKAWAEIVNPDTGKPYRSFTAWYKAQKLSEATAYRIIRHAPVAEALQAVYAEPLTTEQVKLLYPVFRDHGPEDVVTTWKLALEKGGPTAANLTEVIRELKLGQTGEDEPISEADHAKFLRIKKTVSDFDPAYLRSSAQKDPVAARQLLATLDQARAVLIEVVGSSEGE